jgi:adenosylcobinamide-phosphate synthase
MIDLASATEPSLLVLALALAIDLLLGELPARVHPVVWIGRSIALLERVISLGSPRGGPRLQLCAGALLALLVPCAWAAAAAYAIAALARWPLLALLVSALLLKSAFALRGLGQAAQLVRAALAAGRVPDARIALRNLCSRDAGQLDPPALVAATVESVAENTSDSVIAPLCYYALFGLPGAIFYRAVNTLDAMVGYRGRYEYLGKASARLDDLLNLVPARLTAALLLAAGALTRQRVARGLFVLRRDAALTASPNAGRPMAAMAGLLGVQLSKGEEYRLGDPERALEPRTIDDAWRVAAVGALLGALLCALLIAARLIGARHA